jgi:hypothetical protein
VGHASAGEAVATAIGSEFTYQYYKAAFNNYIGFLGQFHIIGQPPDVDGRKWRNLNAVTGQPMTLVNNESQWTTIAGLTMGPRFNLPLFNDLGKRLEFGGKAFDCPRPGARYRFLWEPAALVRTILRVGALADAHPEIVEMRDRGAHDFECWVFGTPDPLAATERAREP